MDNFEQIAKDFWVRFKEHETFLYENLLKRDFESYNKVLNTMNIIKKDLHIDNLIDTNFGIDTRNGMALKERENLIEFIISPLFKKSNIPLLNAMYLESFKHSIPKYWNIVKYKYFQPGFINTITLNYGTDEITEITKDHFSYIPMINKDNSTINLILFVEDSISEHLIKKEKYNDREIYIPKDNGIHAILDSAVGEYNLLNSIDKMEICLESDMKQEGFKEGSYKMENLINELNMINNNPLSNIKYCAHCKYSSNQVKLYICKCKKTYYCDNICQKANRFVHKLLCKP
jgi:hypothetical protein